MIYTLCHKDIPVLNFKVEDDEITEVLNIIHKNHLPVGVFKEYEKGVSEKKQLRAWWKGRSIPASRQNLRDALEVLGNITTEQLVTKSYGLSLSDHYWAKPMDSNLRWKDVNFFENNFSEDVGKALFGTLDIADLSGISFFSPDNTSDGWLKKKWIIDNNERILLKGGSGAYVQEPFNEVLASELCKELSLSHVEYTLTEIDGKYYSACKDFINSETELVPAWYVKNVLKKENNVSEYNHLLNCCKYLGMENIDKIEEQLCKMFTMDCIIANTDRHFNNFGFIRNPNTLEWKGFAPIYDSGTSMFYDISDYDLKKGLDNIYYKDPAKPFAKNHTEQLLKLPCRKFCTDLPFNKIENFAEKAAEIYGKNRHISNERCQLLCEILNNRIEMTNALINSPELFKKYHNNNKDWKY